MLLPREDYFSHSQLSLVACSSLWRVGSARHSPVNFGKSVVILVLSTFRQSCWWEFMGVASHILRRQSRSQFTDILPLTTFAPSYSVFSEPLVWELFCRCVHWYWVPQSALVLFFQCFFFLIILFLLTDTYLCIFMKFSMVFWFPRTLSNDQISVVSKYGIVNLSFHFESTFIVISSILRYTIHYHLLYSSYSIKE